MVYGSKLPLLLAGIKELSAEVETLKTEVAALTDANMNIALELYVNGMLMVSGSNSDVIDGNADYFIVDKSTLSGAFAFNLEADDVIQIISRG